MPVIANHMSRDLLAVTPDASVVDAVRQMVARGVGAVLVMDGDRLAGIFTERDVLEAVAEGRVDGVRVAERMSASPETVEAEEATEHAASLMIHGGFRHLPVVEGDAVVGIVSIRDLMRVALADSTPRGV